jgi:ligand-binding sensor protein
VQEFPKWDLLSCFTGAENRKRQAMKLTDLAPLDKWIELEEDIHQRSGLDVNVFDTKGYRISEFKNWANRLCPEIKATDKGQSFICAPAHMNIATQAMRTKQPLIEECDAGMLKLVVPIFANDEYVGAVGACGFLLDNGEVDSFLVNKMTDISEDKVERLADGIPAITSEKTEILAQYIANQIAKIVTNCRTHPC